MVSMVQLTLPLALHILWFLGRVFIVYVVLFQVLFSNQSCYLVLSNYQTSCLDVAPDMTSFCLVFLPDFLLSVLALTFRSLNLHGSYHDVRWWSPLEVP